MPADQNQRAAAQFSPDDEERILSMRIGGTSVRAALDAAIAEGQVLCGPDGRLRLPDTEQMSPYLYKQGKSAPPGCKFLMKFLYEQVYQKKAVPAGCSACYKVKVISATLRQLMAVRAIAEELPYTSKSGPEVEKRETQNLYGTYFYISTLAEAREVYKQVRLKVDADPALGPSLTMLIKRGCTEYEWAHGSLDDYAFDPRQYEIEAYLRTRFDPRPTARPANKDVAEAAKLLHMVQIAYQIGDQTYKDFTGGEDLYPPIVTYDPAEPEQSPPAAEKRESKAD